MRLASCLSDNIIARADCFSFDPFISAYAIGVACLAGLAYLASRYI